MSTTSLVFEVTSDDTARALGSGDVEVLATPRLLAWCEAATVAALAAADEGGNGTSTSVGTRVRLDVAATDRSGRVVATGEVFRVVVERDRFEARVPAP
jgi:fluoroacetyl-CoA thioesterase